MIDLNKLFPLGEKRYRELFYFPQKHSVELFISQEKDFIIDNGMVSDADQKYKCKVKSLTFS